MNTHLLEWLPGAYDHCKYGSRDWCEEYLNNAVDTIRELQRELSGVRHSYFEERKKVLLLEDANATLAAERDMWRDQAMRGVK